MGVFGVWTVFGLWSANQYLLFVLTSGGKVESWTRPFVIYLASAWMWAAFTPLVVWLSRRAPVERGRVLLSLATLAAAFVALHLLDVWVDSVVYVLASGNPRRPYVPQLLNQANLNMLSFGAVVAVTSALDYYRAYRERHLRAAQLEAQLAQAQLHALRAQLHPHFLFNTLHAISTLMHRDAEAADRMLSRLSDLLRMVLETAAAPEVPLLREVQFIEGYLEIERTRLGSRLQTELDIAPDTYDAVIPQLLLQPLVENAVRHGIAPHGPGGAVRVEARRDNSILRLTVQDDGRGLRVPVGELREGLGLRASRARLQQIYGAAQRFELRNRPAGGVEVVLELPYRREPAGA